MNMFIIRGMRLLQQLIEDATISQLNTNIEREFPNTKHRQHAVPSVQVTTVKLIPYVSDGMLEVNSTTRTGGNGNTHHQKIQFRGVRYGPSNVMTTKFTSVDGTEREITPISLDKSTVKVSCSCLDFHYRFSTWNRATDALVGDPPDPYIKKTNRPPVNPSKVPGVCKHVLKVVDSLQKDRLVG